VIRLSHRRKLLIKRNLSTNFVQRKLNLTNSSKLVPVTSNMFAGIASIHLQLTFHPVKCLVSKTQSPHFLFSFSWLVGRAGEQAVMPEVTEALLKRGAAGIGSLIFSWKRLTPLSRQGGFSYSVRILPPPANPAPLYSSRLASNFNNSGNAQNPIMSSLSFSLFLSLCRYVVSHTCAPFVLLCGLHTKERSSRSRLP